MELETCWIYFATHINFTDGTTKKDIYHRYFESTNNEEDAKAFANTCMKIKIGETCNRGSRRQSLFQSEGITMRETIKFKGTKADRLFVEGYVRSRIEHRYSTFNINHVGNDHFICSNSNIIRLLQKEFPIYVQEGLNLLEKIKNNT